MDADKANASLKDGICFCFIAKVLDFLRYKSGNFRIKFVAREQRWTAVDVDGHGNFAVQIRLAAIDPTWRPLRKSRPEACSAPPWRRLQHCLCRPRADLNRFSCQQRLRRGGSSSSKRC